MRVLATFLLPLLLACGADLSVYGERYGTAPPAAPGAEVTVTFLGCTTLLFDDGETAVMTDGFFTRPGPFAVLTDALMEPDPEIVADALARIGGSRLAVVSPVHSHFDHALDSPEVAKQTGAVVIHYDDFTLPFGSFRAFPSLIAGDLDDSLAPLAALATRDGVRFEMLPLLEPVGLLGAP